MLQCILLIFLMELHPTDVFILYFHEDDRLHVDIILHIYTFLLNKDIYLYLHIYEYIFESELSEF